MNNKLRLKIQQISRHIRLRTYISIGIIVVLAPLAFLAVYGVLGALGGSNATPVAVWHFDEGVDNTCSGGANDACDDSGNGNDGARNNDTSWQTEDKCISGKCLYFDGSADSISVGSAPTLNITGDITISYWAKPTGISSYQEIVAKGGNTTRQYYTGLNSSKWRGCVSLTGSDEHCVTETTGTAVNGKWAFLTLTRSGSTVTFYVNGRSVGTTTASGDLYTTSDDLYIGLASFGEYFNGFVDEVKIFDSALSADQVKAEYAGGAAVLGTQDSKDFLNDGLVGYWNMDDAGIDAEGEIETDKSGNSNNATLYGDNSTGDNGTGLDCTATGKFATGCSLDGTDDYLAMSNPQLYNQDNVTLSAWVNISSFSNNETIYSEGSSSTSNYLWFLVRTNQYMEFRTYNGSTNIYTGSTQLSAGQWYHIVATKDGSTVKLYLNGEPETLSSNLTQFTTALSGFNQAAIGQLYRTSSDFFFGGSLDEVRIYNRTLSPAEVKSLYNWAPGPVGYWPMDENNGTTTTYDKSGNSRNGTLTNITESSWQNGKYGSSLYFDGNGDHVEIVDNDAFSFTTTNQLTVSAWFNPTSLATQAEPVTKGTTSNYEWAIRVETDGSAHAIVQTSAGGTNLVASSANGFITTDNWYHMVMVGDISTPYVSLYINGVLIDTDTTSGGSSSNGTAPIRIGERADGNNDVNGLIDDVKIYNYARTPQQIVEDMNGGHPTGGSPVGSQIARWEFDEQNGQTVNNTGNAGSALNGTLGSSSSSDTNDPTWKTQANCKINGCLDFDGDDNYVSIPTNSALDLDDGDDASFAFWFRPETFATDQVIFVKLDILGTGVGYYFTLSSDNTLGLVATDGTDAFVIETDQTFTSSEWTHVVVVFDEDSATNTKIYINGQVAPTSQPGDPIGDVDSLANSADFEIGTILSGTSSEFDGQIDDLQVFSSALTADQVKIVFNGGASENFGGFADEKTDIVDGAGNPPVGYWPFDDKVKGNSQTLVDKSGNGNNGATVDGGGTVFDCTVPGKFGSACLCDGSNDNILVTDDPVLHVTGAMTISLWTKPNTGGGRMFSKRANERSYQIEEVGGPAYLFKISSDGADEISSGNSSAVSTGEWHHVVAIYRPSTSIELWVDGVLENSNTTGIPATQYVTNYDLGICSGPDSFADFGGYLDDVKLYDYAFTNAQIQYEYNRGAPVGWWQLDDGVTGDSQTVYDASGNSNNGTTSDGGATLDCTVDGKLNTACSFDGSDDHVQISSTFGLGTTNATLAAWVNLDSTSEDGSFVKVGGNIAPFGQGYAIGVGGSTFENTGNNLILLYEGERWIDTNIDIGTGWHHIAMTINSSGYPTGYLDGKAVYSDTIDIPLAPANNATYIGGYTGQSAENRHADATVDDVRVYNYALSADQVKKVMLGGRIGGGARFGPDTGSP